MSEGTGQEKSSKVVPLAVAGTLVLAGGLLAGYWLGHHDDAPAPSAIIATTAPSPGAPVLPGGPEPEPEKDTVGISDPDVTAWHEKVRGPIGGSVVSLANLPLNDPSEVGPLCQNIKLISTDLAAAPEAPKADVEEMFRGWVDSIDAVKAVCLAPGEPAAKLPDLKAKVDASGMQFSNFMRTLDLYFDFSVDQTDPGFPAQQP